jgi:hypothetical protein
MEAGTRTSQQEATAPGRQPRRSLPDEHVASEILGNDRCLQEGFLSLFPLMKRKRLNFAEAKELSSNAEG